MHWASLWGRPQRWHATGACATPKDKDKDIQHSGQNGLAGQLGAHTAPAQTPSGLKERHFAACGEVTLCQKGRGEGEKCKFDPHFQTPSAVYVQYDKSDHDCCCITVCWLSCMLSRWPTKVYSWQSIIANTSPATVVSLQMTMCVISLHILRCYDLCDVICTLFCLHLLYDYS